MLNSARLHRPVYSRQSGLRVAHGDRFSKVVAQQIPEGSRGTKLHLVAENQNWHCPVCGEHLFNGEELQTHHIIPLMVGGSHRAENLNHLHQACHQQLHQMSYVPGLLEA